MIELEKEISALCLLCFREKKTNLLKQLVVSGYQNRVYLSVFRLYFFLCIYIDNVPSKLALQSS